MPIRLTVMWLLSAAGRLALWLLFNLGVVAQRQFLLRQDPSWAGMQLLEVLIPLSCFHFGVSSGLQVSAGSGVQRRPNLMTNNYPVQGSIFVSILQCTHVLQ